MSKFKKQEIINAYQALTDEGRRPLSDYKDSLFKVLVQLSLYCDISRNKEMATVISDMDMIFRFLEQCES